MPVWGSGCEAIKSVEKACGVLNGNTGKLIIAVRHSSPSGCRNRSPRPRTRFGCIGNIRVAATKREAPDDRHAAGLEHDGLREASALAVTLEKTADANALGMIAAKTGIDSIDALKAIDETLWE